MTAVLPAQTSKAIGFTLQSGAGQSKFMTVYGELQLALGIAFLWPLYRPAEVTFPLLLCLLIHGCLVTFRTTGFVLFSGTSTTTYFFAESEWIVFVGAAILFWAMR